MSTSIAMDAAYMKAATLIVNDQVIMAEHEMAFLENQLREKVAILESLKIKIDDTKAKDQFNEDLRIQAARLMNEQTAKQLEELRVLRINHQAEINMLKARNQAKINTQMAKHQQEMQAQRRLVGTTGTTESMDATLRAMVEMSRRLRFGELRTDIAYREFRNLMSMIDDNMKAAFAEISDYMR
jgi:flagellar biosynthesis component FlhA